MMKLGWLLSVSFLALTASACGDDENGGDGNGKPTAAELVRGEGCPDESDMMPAADCDTSSYSACVETQCAGGAPEGEPSPTPGGGGGGCTALMTCCNSLSGEEQTDCNSTLDSLMGNDMVCDATLGIYQASGTCP